MRPTQIWGITSLIVLAACSGPIAMFGLGRAHGAGAQALVQPAMIAPPGCSAGAWHVAGGTGSQDFACQEGVVHVLSQAMPAGANPARVLDAARGPALSSLGGDVDTGILDLAGATPPAWVLLTDRDSGRVAAYVVWIDGAPALGGLRDRLHIARAMFAAASRAPTYALVVSAPTLPVLQAFLGAQTGLASAFKLSAR